MNARPAHLHSATHACKVTPVATVLALITLLGGCAPDAVRSTEATGFNGYIQKIGTVCQNIRIGDKNISEMIRLENGGGDNAYDIFIDATSKLYYNRISPLTYRQNLTGFFGPGTGNDAAFDCILRNLPAQRPNAPS